MENIKENKLSDLRNDKFNLETEVVFGKEVFGGYKKKEVLQYIADLNSRLSTAERSFSERLEEYAAMSSMLTQERDKYMKMVQNNEAEYSKYREQIIDLQKEKEELSSKVDELSETALDKNEIAIFEEKLAENEDMKIQISNLEEKVKEYEKYKEYNDELKNNIVQLELSVKGLNEQLEECSKYEITREEYEILVSENENIKQQCDAATYEKSMIVAEKNVLLEKNKRLTQSLNEANEKTRELRDANSKIKLKTKKMMTDFESKLYECGQNHKQNIEQITENVKSVLNIITYENMDITKLLSISDENIDFEDGSKAESEDK
ncbi:MAG: hypothetical protein Q8873_08245 [Bacillota bacterium]|nr:hypothetical protein [Bacillota bacterium]